YFPACTYRWNIRTSAEELILWPDLIPSPLTWKLGGCSGASVPSQIAAGAETPRRMPVDTPLLHFHNPQGALNSLQEQQKSPERALEEAVSRALRDNLGPLQRTADELHQAYADLVAACSSARPSNALPAMLRAQTAAAALAAGLSVLSNFVAVALNPRDSYAGGESAARPGAGAAASSRGAGAAIAEEEADSSGGRAAAETEEASEWAEEPSRASLEIPAEPPVRANAHAGGSARPAAHREEIETPEEPEGEPVAEAIVELDEEPAAEAAPAFDVANLPTELQDLHRRANRVAKVAMQDIKMLRP